MNPNRVMAMRAWFFWDKKLNISRIYGSLKGKRREECAKHECGRATNAFGEWQKKKSPTVAEDFPLNLNQNS
jgi:hypothetical protein